MFKTIFQTGYEFAANYYVNVANLLSGQAFTSKTLHNIWIAKHDRKLFPCSIKQFTIL